LLAYAQRLAPDGSVEPGWPIPGVLLPNRGFDQSNHRAVSDGAGGVIVATDDKGLRGVITVHRLNGEGTAPPGWPSGGVTVRGTAGQEGGTWGNFLPDIERDTAEGLFLSWTFRDKLHQCIRLERFRVNGASAPGWDPGATWAGYRGGAAWQYPSVVCRDGAEGAFVASGELNPRNVFVHHFDGSGNAVFSAAVPVSVTDGQTAPGIVADGSGGVIVAWQDNRNASYQQTYAQHLNPDGSRAPGWPEDGLPLSNYSTAPGIASDFVFSGALTSIVPDGSDGAFVAWTDFRDDAASGDIYLQHIDGDGLAPGWPANGLAVCRLTGDQQLPRLAYDKSGGVFLTWQDQRGASGYDIYVQRITGEGMIAEGWPGNGFPVSTAFGDQVAPVPVTDGEGNVIVAWTDRRSGVEQIYANRVARDGAVPVLASFTGADATSELIRLSWFTEAAPTNFLALQRRTSHTAWTRIAELRPDPRGRLEYVDRDVISGERYTYRLGLVGPEGEIYTEEIWVTVPIDIAFGLHGVDPNPSSQRLRVSFSLETSLPATLELLDVGGRRLETREVGSFGPGNHHIELTGDAPLAPGVYVVQLVQSQRRQWRRAIVVR